ncbi:HI1506-related protein [Photobacterium sanguinicancri]|uniref:HI1506-related protein n=1 Tax=Photobacterium sanguinicancri TaxID=875932 RepID=UPI0026E4701E|nr:HI1506-related protein [Photobacterium sanguinicancri]MDO6497329.1 HI1506-related protein [Photobacterium sanguinicancri]
MANPSLIAQSIVVACSAHTGYRRAGLEFANGKNIIQADAITETQLAQLKADHRLAVSDATEQNPSVSQPHTTGPLDDAKLPDAVTAFCKDGALTLAIANLDPENPDHFTSTNKPQVGALSQLVGRTLTATERDEAWACFQSNANKALAES